MRIRSNGYDRCQMNIKVRFNQKLKTPERQRKYECICKSWFKKIFDSKQQKSKYSLVLDKQAGLIREQGVDFSEI